MKHQNAPPRWGVLFEWIYKMQAKDSWLLPDGIEEILPEQAGQDIFRAG